MCYCKDVRCKHRFGMVEIVPNMVNKICISKNDRVFYKVNEGIYISEHSEMVKGDNDYSTIEFICEIIGLDDFEIDNLDTDDYLYSNYGIRREVNEYEC